MQSLNIRKQSLPFDWLNTEPIKGLGYVVDNIKHGFQFFLADLDRNHNGHVVSSRYPFAEFMHEKHLIENEVDQQRFVRRAKRFMELIQKECVFVYNITSESLKSSVEVNEFFKSVMEFKKLMSHNQRLYIYIRHDESFDENRSYCDELMKKIKDGDNVKVVKYITYKQTYGLWGNEKAYRQLYNVLGLKVRLVFPKVYFK
jgi:hypothetical protein